MCELAGVDNYRAMIDVSTVVAKSGESFDWSWVKEIISSVHAQKSFALFMDRIAHCVDSRALDWPIDRKGLNYRKRVYTFVSSHPRSGRLLAALTRYAT